TPGLVVEQVAATPAVGAVPVVHRPAEGGAFLAVAVAADRQVVAGEDEGIFVLARRIAEDVRAAVLELAGGIPLLGARVAADAAIAVVARRHGLDDAFE